MPDNNTGPGDQPTAASPPPDPPKMPEVSREDELSLRMGRATVPPDLQDPDQRERWSLPADDDTPGDYMIEINLLYKDGLEAAAKRFVELHEKALQGGAATRQPLLVSKTYYRCKISVREWRRLIALDERNDQGQPNDKRERAIYKIWPDFPIKALIDRSISTVKADAAVRSYAATGAGIIWAVIDSGIEGSHIHFGGEKNPTFSTLRHPDVANLHRDFTIEGSTTADSVASALTDGYGHGTHVAGIIAGGLDDKLNCGPDFHAYEQVFESDPDGQGGKTKKFEPRTVDPASSLRGVAPQCKLISLKVLDERGMGRASNVMRALQYIREELNGDPKLLRVQGVNLSIGYEFDAEMFACGQSPLCVEVDRIVKSGVVVVVAAGNTGYGKVGSQQRDTKVGLSNTINDPGNAALAVTVGSTHRDSPHTYGVSYFSSKGPTGDGRLKPDLVAPGERITSCAAGRQLQRLGGIDPHDKSAYVDDSGTSMAAPHVSGAVAAFLSIRREFIQRPEEVKRIFLESATPLGRERYFEGSGLVDLMRAIQRV